MDPVTNKLLQGTPYAGMGGTQERNALIGVIRNLISEDKYTVDYILNYAQSVGYQRQMTEEVFKELTGLSPKLIVNNNEYYNMPAYVPNMCIAWGTSKSNKEKAFYIVPFECGYAVMEKDEVNAPVPTVISATIPEAFDELKKVAKGIQTLDKIITKKLLETEDVQTDAHTVHQVNLPYATSPLQVLKKNFKDKVLSVSEFERQAAKLLQEEGITVDEAEDLMHWKQDLIEEDESYANETLQLDENWKPLDADATENADEENVDMAFDELLGMLEELDILSHFANDINKNELQAYEELVKDIASDWQVNPNALKGKLILEKPELWQKMNDLVNKRDEEDIKNWKKQNKKESFQTYSENLEKALKYIEEQTSKDNNAERDLERLAIEEAEKIFNIDGDLLEQAWEKRNKKQASKKITAENITLDDIEAEDNKDQVQEEIEKIEETPTDEIFSETTPEQYFDKALQEDKVDTINDVVSKCIDKFSEKFKDFDKYQVKILSYNTKVLEDDKPMQDEMVQDKEIDANAILQVILQVTNNAEESNIKKVLAVFSITNGKLHWTGTIRGENDQVVAFTEEGLDALFEVEEPSEDELEDII